MVLLLFARREDQPKMKVTRKQRVEGRGRETRQKIETSDHRVTGRQDVKQYLNLFSLRGCDRFTIKVNLKSDQGAGRGKTKESLGRVVRSSVRQCTGVLGYGVALHGCGVQRIRHPRQVQ